MTSEQRHQENTRLITNGELNHYSETIRQLLEQVVASAEFAKSAKMAQLLRYLVNKALSGEVDAIKQFTIATEVFGRDINFDHQTDPIVRVQAGRVRNALAMYYLTEGQQDAIQIEIPKGTYLPQFRRIEAKSGKNGKSGKIGESGEMPSTLPNAVSQLYESMPTVAVLPFKFYGENAAKAYLAEGFGDELSLLLSRFNSIGVIAYFSCIKVFEENSQLSLRELGNALGADYIVSGSLSVTGDTLLVRVSINHTESGLLVWGEKYRHPSEATGIDALLEQTTSSICNVLADESGLILQSCSEKVLEKPLHERTAIDAVMLNHRYNLSPSLENFKQSLESLELAVQHTLRYSRAWALLAQTYLDAYTFGYARDRDYLALAREAINRALEIDPHCQYSYYAACFAALIDNDAQRLRTAAQQMITLNPHSAFMVGAAGWFIGMSGDYDDGIELIRRSHTLNPVLPSWFYILHFLQALVHDDKAELLASARRFDIPGFYWSHILLAVGLHANGDVSQAKAQVAALKALNPDFFTQPDFYLARYIVRPPEKDRIRAVLESLNDSG